MLLLYSLIKFSRIFLCITYQLSELASVFESHSSDHFEEISIDSTIVEDLETSYGTSIAATQTTGRLDVTDSDKPISTLTSHRVCNIENSESCVNVVTDPLSSTLLISYPNTETELIQSLDSLEMHSQIPRPSLSEVFIYDSSVSSSVKHLSRAVTDSSRISLRSLNRENSMSAITVDSNFLTDNIRSEINDQTMTSICLESTSATLETFKTSAFMDLWTTILASQNPEVPLSSSWLELSSGASQQTSSILLTPDISSSLFPLFPSSATNLPNSLNDQTVSPTPTSDNIITITVGDFSGISDLVSNTMTTALGDTVMALTLWHSIMSATPDNGVTSITSLYTLPSASTYFDNERASGDRIMTSSSGSYIWTFALPDVSAAFVSSDFILPSASDDYFMLSIPSSFIIKSASGHSTVWDEFITTSASDNRLTASALGDIIVESASDNLNFVTASGNYVTKPLLQTHIATSALEGDTSVIDQDRHETGSFASSYTLSSLTSDFTITTSSSDPHLISSVDIKTEPGRHSLRSSFASGQSQGPASSILESDYEMGTSAGASALNEYESESVLATNMPLTAFASDSSEIGPMRTAPSLTSSNTLQLHSHSTDSQLLLSVSISPTMSIFALPSPSQHVSLYPSPSSHSGTFRFTNKVSTLYQYR